MGLVQNLTGTKQSKKRFVQNQARSKKKRSGLVQTGSKQSEQTYSKLCEIQAMRLFAEAVRVLVEAVRVIIKAIRKIIEAARLFVEAV
jgi:hypothetical protein